MSHVDLTGVWVQEMGGAGFGGKKETVLRTGKVLEELNQALIVRWYDQQLEVWLYAETIARCDLWDWRFYFDGPPVLVAGEQ